MFEKVRGNTKLKRKVINNPELTEEDSGNLAEFILKKVKNVSS